MASFHGYCACGNEIAVEGVSVAKMIEIRELWQSDHSKPGCKKLTFAQFITLKVKTWMTGL